MRGFCYNEGMISVVLFLFGIAIGSFVNVLALRYDGDKWNVEGRSHCPHCGRTLKWFELIPLASFFIQRARCRSCKARIGWQYPLVEFLSGLVFVFVPSRLAAVYGPSAGFIPLAVLWVAAVLVLLLLAYIDILLEIVPHELTIALGVLGIFIGIFAVGNYGLMNQSFLGPYATIFGFQNNFWVNRIFAALVGATFFELLVLVTPRVFGKQGMGMGDVLLALPLGFLFGWPDILPLYGAAFILGAVAGVVFILAKKKTAKSQLPFVPFLVLGAAFVFWFGLAATGAYFRIMGL